jgi:hypothetical protein
MGERRNVLEIANGNPRIAAQIPNPDRSPLYDVINPACAFPKECACEAMFSRTTIELSTIALSTIALSTIALSTIETLDDLISLFRVWQAGAICRRLIPSGGARRDRTDDLMLAKHALSQLSYGPVPEDEMLPQGSA